MGRLWYLAAMTKQANSASAKGDVVVIGGGHFGGLAIERLGGRVRLVVEPSPTRQLLGMGTPVKQADGVVVLEQMLSTPDRPRWVIPAVPLHLLKEWLVLSLADQNPRGEKIPPHALPQVASLMPGPAGQFFLSLADFKCPDDCPEPARLCTVTGKPRGEDMWLRLSRTDWPQGRVGVLRSRQLAPGIGGLLVQEMLELRERIRPSVGCWLLATACRCHGVVDAVRFDPQP